MVVKVILFRVGQEEETVILAKMKGYSSDLVQIVRSSVAGHARLGSKGWAAVGSPCSLSPHWALPCRCECDTHPVQGAFPCWSVISSAAEQAFEIQEPRGEWKTLDSGVDGLGPGPRSSSPASRVCTT